MKKTISILFITTILISTFTSCKKGDNDPAISLLSRKARLTAEWELTDWSRTEISGSNFTTYYFNGSILTTIIGNNTSSTSSYTENLEVLSDGTYSIKTTQVYTGNSSSTNTYSEDGYWSWLEGNKQDKIKDKERVHFSPKSVSINYNGNASYISYDGDNEGISFRISRLSSKELIVETEYSETNTASDYIYSIKEIKTYTKK